MEPNLSLFALPSSRPLAEGIAHRLGIPLSELREEQFPDGEKKISPMHSVERESVVLFQSLLGEAGHSPNEKICELLFLLHTLRDHGAREITLVAPYLAYARSDIRHDALDSLYLKSLAEMLESAGLGRLITLDVHNPAAFENAFRYCIAQNLESSSLFCKYLKKLEWSNAPLVVLSPDLGGIKRAAKFHTRLEQALGRAIQFSFLEKYRRGNALEGTAIVESVEGAEVLIYDDMISTGGTILRAMDACRRGGAQQITVLATHGIFSQDVAAILDAPLLRQLIVTDSNPALKDDSWTQLEKLTVLSCASLISDYLATSLPASAEERVA